MGDYPTSVGVMFPARFMDGYPLGNDIVDLHTTIMYLGEFDTIDFELDDVMKALAGIEFNVYIIAKVIGKEAFGDNKDIPVLRVESPAIDIIYNRVSGCLANVGIESASSFPEYKPHVTVTPEVWSKAPRRVLLEPAQVWWGDERIKLWEDND